MVCFNPLPSPKQGETVPGGPVAGTGYEFQSAPLTEARGDEVEVLVVGVAPQVSIRSPHRSKGRQAPASPTAKILEFQSAPLTEARGDRHHHHHHRRPCCFNPLPSPKQGETTQAGEDGVLGRVSIRSPHRSKGRHIARRYTLARGHVSIRSPHRSKGRLDLVEKIPNPVMGFNPLPSPKQGETLRRNAGGGARRGSFNPLPSPKQGETSAPTNLRGKMRQFQSAPLTEARGDQRESPGRRPRNGFQSAPLTEARGDSTTGWSTTSSSTSFNPLPSPKQGETGDYPALVPALPVSIRSPHRSKGRLVGDALGDRGHAFQSAPLTEARGDREPPQCRPSRLSFNPLPSPKQGETPYG